MRAALHRKVCAAFALLFGLGLAGTAVAADEKSDAVALAAAGTSAVGPDYIIGQRDTLRVFVLRSPELTAEVPVRPDGKISTPLVNDMQAVGKTASQLAHDIEVVLGEFVRSPTVSVIVTSAQGGNGQVRVVGQAVNPRSLPFRAGMTVLDVVIEVGGLSQYAAGNRATLIRTESGKEHKTKLKLKDLLEDGDMSQNLPIERGDVIVIPESRF
ncbi:MAG TPA: XrtA/PEP-CTERM system exopolysaccharide export protein [Steroidobacteraceae bacterium]|nr:XrtA/PEP-CTERM system exopolysaccharide export protein [Steroidobacteraceae bacterium]